MNLVEYQKTALATDQNQKSGPAGLLFPLLGLSGEVGSLLAEAKKKQRDGAAYNEFRTALLEEFGDVLWYFSNLASRAGISLGELEQLTVDKPRNDLSRDDWRNGNLTEFQGQLIRLAGDVGLLVNDFSTEDPAVHATMLAKRLPGVFRALVAAANLAGITTAEAADANIRKIRDRWPPPDAMHTPLFDTDFDPDEQLPRDIKMQFLEKQIGHKTYAIQKCNGIKIGDRLTDNMTEDDGYRYHDIFHLAFAATLGWSPVTRALFKCKRKSNSLIDEVEDGARAIVIEEGVSTWIFNLATRHNFFEGLTTLDYDLLKRIKILVKGFEVDSCASWEWEKAILNGYTAFRKVRQNRGGLVHADLLRRSITVE